MKRFFMIPAVFSALLCCGEMQFKIINQNNEKLSAFPIVIPADVSGDFNAVKIKNAAGKLLPVQWDDLNGNGMIDPADEIAFLPDLLPGKNVFTCRFFKDKSAVVTPENGKEPILSIENALVKVSQHKQKLLLRNVFFKKGTKLIPAAGAFVLEPRMDNSWKWRNSSLTVKKISSGPIRQVLCVELVKTGTDNGKTVKILNVLSVFAKRQEILSTLCFVNTSSSQLVQINTVNTGMYQVMSDGKNPVADLSFSGTNRNNKVIRSGKISAGGLLHNRPAPSENIWGNVFSDQAGFGMTPCSADNVRNFLIRRISSGKAIRMSVLFGFEKAVLWPKKSVSCSFWMIPGSGADSAVEKFAVAIKNIRVER